MGRGDIARHLVVATGGGLLEVVWPAKKVVVTLPSGSRLARTRRL